MSEGFHTRTRAFLRSVPAFTLCCAVLSTTELRADAAPFTVAREIGIAQFQSYSGSADGFVQFSPNGEYLAAYVERGLVSADRVQGSLRIYRTSDLRRFLRGRSDAKPPTPWWTIEKEEHKSPAISSWRWMADSAGITFLQCVTSSSCQLVVASVASKSVSQLSADGESALSFVAHDAKNYVYVVGAAGGTPSMEQQGHIPAVSLNGRSLVGIIFPGDTALQETLDARLSRSTVWAVVDGRRHRLTDRAGMPLTLRQGLDPDTAALSPNGRWLVTSVPVRTVPEDWATLYPAPYPGSLAHVRTGGPGSKGIPAQEFVRINLATNEITPLTDAPTSAWLEGGGSPQWSADGEAILLPSTFWKSGKPGPVRPCGALYWDVPTQRASCLSELQPETGESQYPEGFRFIDEVRFDRDDKRHVVLRFVTPHGKWGIWEYRQNAGGHWSLKKRSLPGPQNQIMDHDVVAVVAQDFRTPPVLMIRDTTGNKSRAIWDPNPQLSEVSLGESTVYHWKDELGREWRGALFKPNGFEINHRYPLVIQNHGFAENEFRPSGVFPTAFAALALAGAGIAVLHVDDSLCTLGSRDENECAARGFEAGVHQLVQDGIADAGHVGIVGFSRTCDHVLQLMTSSRLQLRAASITDGAMSDYFQYLIAVTDDWPKDPNEEADALIGAQPFGIGLRTWIERSPLFNIEKANAPLLVVGLGKASLLSMWGPYAALHRLGKPVELVMINTDEHVLTNPAARLASQGGTVDWFRFWLQD